jgi:putative FmdB family regulatory protein
MPLYEYYCPECKDTFEALRSTPEADAPVACPSCRQVSTQRILSLFARSVNTSVSALETAPMGGCGCGGGACGCH